jgi:hypothetical protein
MAAPHWQHPGPDVTGAQLHFGKKLNAAGSGAGADRAQVVKARYRTLDEGGSLLRSWFALQSATFSLNSSA